MTDKLSIINYIKQVFIIYLTFYYFLNGLNGLNGIEVLLLVVAPGKTEVSQYNISARRYPSPFTLVQRLVPWCVCVCVCVRLALQFNSHVVSRARPSHRVPHRFTHPGAQSGTSGNGGATLVTLLHVQTTM